MSIPCSEAGFIDVTRADYLAVGGRKKDGTRSKQMHFLNLEMHLVIKLKDTL